MVPVRASGSEEELEARRHKAFQMHVDEGMTYEDIAKELGVHRKTVQRDIGIVRHRKLRADVLDQRDMTAQEVIESVFNKLGGVDFVVEWAKKYPGEFLTKIWIKLLPKKIQTTMKARVEADVFQRIEQLTAQFVGGALPGADPGHDPGEPLDSQARPAPVDQAVALINGPAT